MKTINFYIQLTIILIGIMNPISIWMLFALVVTAFWFFMYRNLSANEIYDISGINWIKAKCKNSGISKITNDLTEE